VRTIKEQLLGQQRVAARGDRVGEEERPSAGAPTSHQVSKKRVLTGSAHRQIDATQTGIAYLRAGR
jgi:hypothetical protein